MPYDIVIVGAGPGGSTTAYYLARAGLKVLLLDKFDFPRDKTCGDGLTPPALGVLDDMGLLDQLSQVGCRIDMLELIAPDGSTVESTIPPQQSGPGYSLVIPRLALDEAIRQQALASGAEFQSRVQVTAIEPNGAGVVVSGGRRGRSMAVKAGMAVIATGANTSLLLAMGILKERPAMMVAARAYFEQVQTPPDRTQFYFADPLLPGYGWVFPLPNGAANIGAGYMRRGRFAKRMPPPPATAFEQFIQLPALCSMLAQARQVGPVKGFPLRTDFATAPTFGERTLLVGESAGLVNPLTGEGIDYALKSGKIAAHHLIEMFAAGDFSSSRLAAYDQALRREFQAIFRFSRHMQGFLPYRSLLNRLVKGAARQPELRTLLINIVLGQYDLSAGLPRLLKDISIFRLIKALI